MSLTTLSQVKTFLNVTNTSQDAWLDSLRTAAEIVVKDYCGQSFEYTTSQVEFYSGTSQKTFTLRQRPVLAINNLWLDFNGSYGQAAGAFASTTLLTQGTDYRLQLDGNISGSAVSFCGNVERINSIWMEIGRTYYPDKLSAEIGPASGCLKVDYSSGYQTIPQSLQYAVGWLVAFMRRTIKLGQVLVSERLGDYSYEVLNFMRRDLHPELTTARQILSRYREDGWAIL